MAGLLFVLGLTLFPGGTLLADRSRMRHPLKGPIFISGSFGEYRNYGRYHYGVDYKTFNRVGLPVYMPSYGTVTAMNISRRGYGNALWVSSRFGRYTFAHLQDFHGQRPGLEYIRQSVLLLFPGRSLRLGLPGWFRFKQGAHFANTGESGSGAPHLHFEVLRRGSFLDALSFRGMGIKDRTPPRLLNLYLHHRGFTRSISVRKTKSSGLGKRTDHYVPTKPVRVTPGARVRFSIGSYDTMVAQNRNGVSSFALYEGSKRLYRRTLRRISLGRTSSAETAYDSARTVIGREYVYRLFGRSSGGRKLVGRKFRIEVADVSGNKGVLTFEVGKHTPAPGSAGRGSSKRTEPTRKLQQFRPGHMATLSARSGRATLSLKFRPGSLHLPSSFGLRPLNRLPAEKPWSTRKDAAKHMGKLYEQAGPAFTVDTEKTYYRLGAYGTASYPAGDRFERAALFYFSRTTRRWRLLALPRKRGNRIVYRFRYRTTGPIARLLDASPPRMGRKFRWRVPESEKGSALLRREFAVSDHGTGVDYRGFDVRLDGVPFPYRWIPDRAVLEVRIPRKLIGKRGALLAVRASDRSQNRSDWQYEFVE